VNVGSMGGLKAHPTLVKEANNSRGSASRGTASDWPRASASVPRITAAQVPASPRANNGGHCCSNSFISGQFRAQPKAVTTRQREPIVRSRCVLSIGRA